MLPYCYTNAGQRTILYKAKSGYYFMVLFRPKLGQNKAVWSGHMLVQSTHSPAAWLWHIRSDVTFNSNHCCVSVAYCLIIATPQWFAFQPSVMLL